MPPQAPPELIIPELQPHRRLSLVEPPRRQRLRQHPSLQRIHRRAQPGAGSGQGRGRRPSRHHRRPRHRPRPDRDPNGSITTSASFRSGRVMRHTLRSTTLRNSRTFPGRHARQRVQRRRREAREIRPPQRRRHARREMPRQQRNIPAPLPQRRQPTTSNASRSSRSARNRPAAASAGRSALVAAITRTSTPKVSLPPTRSKLRIRSRAGSFPAPQAPRWRSRPGTTCPRRQLKPPGAAAHRRGERARLMPEQLQIQQRFRQGRAVQRHERPVPARRQIGQPGRDRFLAGPASPTTSTGRSSGAKRETCASMSRKAGICRAGSAAWGKSP